MAVLLAAVPVLTLGELASATLTSHAPRRCSRARAGRRIDGAGEEWLRSICRS